MQKWEYVIIHIFADESDYIDTQYTMDVTTGRRKNRRIPERHGMPGNNGRNQSRMRRKMRT